VSGKLAKAILVRLKETAGSGPDAPSTLTPDERGAFAVQFNPTSLKITRQNNIDKGGSTTNTQRRQSSSPQPATLTFDLEFDTAEGDENGAPQNVRIKTQIIRQFVEPTREAPQQPPPLIRFIWGNFVFTGIVTQLTEDLDYFAANGEPLRAKVSVTVTEQDADFEAKLIGPASRNSRSASEPGRGGSGPGTKPAANPRSVAVAQGGESLQQLLSRLGADPATWRAAMAGLTSPIGLAAGAQVQLGAQVSAGAGLGITAGFAAGGGLAATGSLSAALGISASGGISIGASASAGAGFSASAGAGLSAGFGMSAGAGLSAGGGFSAASGAVAGGVAAGAGEIAAGFALAEGGGVAASFNVVAGVRAEVAVAQARAAFDLPALTVSAATGSGAPALPDPRGQSYGAGIPLQARAQAGTVGQVSVVTGSVLTPRAKTQELPISSSPATPPWRQLPPAPAERAGADAQQRSRDVGNSTMRWRPGR
jgi:hypothetical protein